MKKNIFLNKALFSIAAILFATSAIAIPQDPCAPKDVCCEEPAPGPFAFSYPKDVGLSCPRDFYVHGEFLLMKPSEEGLEYGLKIIEANPSFLFSFNSKIVGFSRNSDEWDWRPGFRVGFGFNSMHDTWTFIADWTYFRMKADSEVSNVGSPLNILPLWFSGIDIGVVSLVIPNASARWSGDYNTMDIMIGKPYHVSRYFISNPMFGIRSAWIDQDYLVRYFSYSLGKSIVKLKNDYWGVGLRGLYEGEFLLGSGWNIYGKIALSLLFGKFDISQQMHQAKISAIILEYKTEDSFYSVQPNAEIGFGFSWKRFFNKKQYLASLKVGYEFHHWWNQNQARRFFDKDPTANDTISRGDLSFNGVYVWTSYRVLI